VWFGSEEAAKSDGWLILRFSGTEPRLRIFAEAGTMGEAEALVDIMARYVGLKN
jgi:phosphomannomutase